MRLIQLTHSNFELLAARYYENPECESHEEFKEDLQHFKYIKRIFRKYKRSGEFDEKATRLALNHIILVINMWGILPGSSLLFFKIEPDLHPMLKTVLLYLHSLPKVVNGINTNDIPVDHKIVEILRKI